MTFFQPILQKKVEKALFQSVSEREKKNLRWLEVE